MKAKKKFGQNFLIDTTIIKEIANSVNASSDDLVIEIGPGRGALTKCLLDKNVNVLAYEIDTDMKCYLDKLSNLTVIYGDVLESNVLEDIKNFEYNNVYLVGNLPYYITTPIIDHFTKSGLKFKSFTVMVQKEVANRFSANTKCKDYGYFTCYLNNYYSVDSICFVGRNCFDPSPNVDSAVIRLNKEAEFQKEDEEFLEFLKKCFSGKRKTLKNNLKDYDFNKILTVLEIHNLSSQVRAEEINVNILKEIYNVLNENVC